MKKYLAKSKLKSVYVENGKATKVFAKTYNKSDVLYEALNTSRVEDAGVNIPKLLEVAVTDGKWSITSEYVEGPTLTQLIEKYPDKADDYIKKMVEYQISFQKKSNPLLLVLKDKMNRQINSIEELDNSVKYELLTRLNSMKNHTKLCHGDYCPDNIIVTAENGDEDAIESLTIEDIDTYNELSNRVMKEDIFTIVDSTFMPCGVECDQYSVIGEILELYEEKNRYTGESIYKCIFLVSSIYI